MSDRQLIEDLLSALEYHTEQTRPIEFSKVAIQAAREYLRQPAQQEPGVLEQEPVGTAFVVTIEDAALKMLDDMISPSLDEECNPIRLIAGKGHSGYGLYICSEDYPEEGAELLAEIPPLYTAPPAQAQRTWVGLSETERAEIEVFCEMMIGRPAFDAIEAKLEEKNSGN